ncbi:hypothetical protein KK466_29375, partial [Klebsiella pneumoniae]|uniref:hypothetical protein n=1 Tax=Klebsiella pneumoniae TaxID=573 RepID=UPI001BE06096
LLVAKVMFVDHQNMVNAFDLRANKTYINSNSKLILKTNVKSFHKSTTQYPKHSKQLIKLSQNFTPHKTIHYISKPTLWV